VDEPRKFFKASTVVSALVLGGIVIFICGAAVQLMGTKSSALFQTVATSTPATSAKQDVPAAEPNQPSPQARP